MVKYKINPIAYKTNLRESDSLVEGGDTLHLNERRVAQCEEHSNVARYTTVTVGGDSLIRGHRETSRGTGRGGPGIIHKYMTLIMTHFVSPFYSTTHLSYVNTLNS